MENGPPLPRSNIKKVLNIFSPEIKGTHFHSQSDPLNLKWKIAPLYPGVIKEKVLTIIPPGIRGQSFILKVIL